MSSQHQNFPDCGARSLTEAYTKSLKYRYVIRLVDIVGPLWKSFLKHPFVINSSMKIHSNVGHRSLEFSHASNCYSSILHLHALLVLKVKEIRKRYQIIFHLSPSNNLWISIMVRGGDSYREQSREGINLSWEEMR